jgi:hypothetical protein
MTLACFPPADHSGSRRARPYILPFGSGYFYASPGVDDTVQGDFLGRGLMEAASGS